MTAIADDDRLTDEQSELADRVSVAAKSWARSDALEHRDPRAELGLLLEVLNELNSRRLRIERIEGAARRAVAIIDANLSHQREKVEDAASILRDALVT